MHMDDVAISNQPNEQTVEHAVEDFDATMPSKSQRRPETPVRRPAPGELDETRPHSITEVAGRVMMEPISPGLYNLTYACLLVPRFTSHYLTGDISERSLNGYRKFVLPLAGVWNISRYALSMCNGF